MARPSIRGLTATLLLWTAAASAQSPAPLHVVPARDIARAVEALPEPAPRGLQRLAAEVPVTLELDDGQWRRDADGLWHWRLRVRSPGAGLLILGFDDLQLPAGATLHVSTPLREVTRGPYGAPDRASSTAPLWTTMIPGEEALVELRTPAREAVRLRLHRVGHGVVPYARAGLLPKSDDCNLDVICETEPEWQAPIRSVVLLQVGTVSCTGNLINTTANDGRPYVLTANHCDIPASPAGSVTAFFNFVTSECGGEPDGSKEQAIRARARLFQHGLSDHALINLADIPPLSYAAYYTGFDAADALPQSGRSIHHPSGDEKRISTYSGPVIRDTVEIEDFTVDAFRVFWTRGITEFGSSGGGLWNENQRLVGVLSGGTASCEMPLEPDFYGRFKLAWDSGLKTFLDPQNTGRIEVAGREGDGTGEPGVIPPDPGPVGPGGAGGLGASGGGAFGAAGVLLLIGMLRRGLRGWRRRR